MNSVAPKKDVWVIDDDVTVLLLAEEALAAAGFAVRTFPNAAAALEAARAQMPDIFVVDVMMPGLNGFDLCTHVRHLPDGDLVPILVTTSLDDTASINRAYCAGATNFASKPINWAVEIHRLNYLLKSAEAAKQLRHKEQETRQAKEEWERTFDSINDSVVVLDKDFRILRANKATLNMFKNSQSAVSGRRCFELFHANGQPCAGCPATTAFITKLPKMTEVHCAPTGNLFEVTVSPVKDSEGRITHLVHVARDLNEKKQLEAELRHAQKMEAVGTLAGGIAHDFNNLLTVIQCCAEMLEEDKPGNDEDAENISAILDTARRGSALTKQLLLFSRKNSKSPQRRVVDLNETLHSLGRMLEKGLSKNIAEHYHLAPGLHKIFADSSQIEQVVMNLAVNAAHAMPRGGVLTIETENIDLDANHCQRHPDLAPGKYVLLSVSDTGHGMDKQTQARIYEPFFTTKQVGEGTGLGLSVVFGIVKEHNGCINCYSEVGVGTTFRVFLPAIPAANLQSSPPTQEKPVTPGGVETILVVDDEAPIRSVLEKHLAKLGYSVVSADDGAMALRRYTDALKHPDAIVMDIGMPNMSGWECLKKLLSLNPQVKVILMSGYGGTDLEERAISAGARGFLHKPYNLQEVSKKLRGHP